jgi:hypothetical protein
MLRRRILFALLCLPELARAQVLTLAARLAVLTELLNVVGAAGDAMKKLAQGFEQLGKEALHLYDVVAARRQREQLLDISRRTALLITTHNAAVVAGIARYLGETRHEKSDWLEVVGELRSTLTEVSNLFKDVKANTSKFISEPAYETLLAALYGRENVLTKLVSLPAPNTPQELHLLADINDKYQDLIAASDDALSALNKYIKAHP